MAYVYETPQRPIRVQMPDTPVRPQIFRSPTITQSMNSAFRRINFNSPYLSYDSVTSTPVKNQNINNNIPNAPMKENKKEEYFATPKKLDFENKQKIAPPPPVKRQREYPLDELVEGMPPAKKVCFDK